jgi:hypothetical protein
MDEGEWLTSTDLTAMLAYVRSYEDVQPFCNWVSDRKLRLFGCACCRWNLHTSADPVCAELVTIGEKLADGEPLTEHENTAPGRRTLRDNGSIEEACAWIARRALPVSEAVRLVIDQARRRGAEHYHADGAAFADLLRDVVGNPFGPWPEIRAFGGLMRVGWLTSDVLGLAKAAYEERSASGSLDHARLLVLSDALEEAGCQDATILGHLRGGALHFRGCFVLDALLGKR